jgi:hypothetical protein
MQAAAAFRPLPDVQIVADAVPRDSLPGMPVQLTISGVTSAPDPAGFWVTQVSTPSIFVAFAPDAQRVPVKFNDAVEVTGRVRKSPDRDTLRQRWPGLSSGDVARLERQGVYVEAREVSIVGEY